MKGVPSPHHPHQHLQRPFRLLQPAHFVLHEDEFLVGLFEVETHDPALVAYELNEFVELCGFVKRRLRVLDKTQAMFCASFVARLLSWKMWTRVTADAATWMAIPPGLSWGCGWAGNEVGDFGAEGGVMITSRVIIY